MTGQRRIAALMAMLATSISVPAGAESHTIRTQRATAEHAEREVERACQIAAAMASYDAKARLKEERETAQLKEILRARIHDPAWVRPVLSAIACSAELKRNENLAALSEARNRQKLGGTVSPMLLFVWSQRVRDADDEISEIRKRLTAMEAAEMRCMEARCGDWFVGAIMKCESDGSDETCRDETVADHVELLRFFRVRVADAVLAEWLRQAQLARCRATQRASRERER